MQDNVRVGRQSLTKKISYPEKQVKAYRTIETLEKEPTRKKIGLHQTQSKQDSHSFLASKHLPERKIKSLTKCDVSYKSDPRRPADNSKKRSVMSSVPELATIDGALHRNMQLIKFSISRERERLMSKQKYKRSEQIRSVLESKKMTSISKLERKNTENSVRTGQNYRQNESQEFKIQQKEKISFRDIVLDTFLNPYDNQNEPTLQHIFQSACALFYQYLASKQKLPTSQGKTEQLKIANDKLQTILESVSAKLGTILSEAGEMSIKTILMIGIVRYEQARYNDAISYLGRVLDKTNGNFLLIVLPGPSSGNNEWCGLSSGVSRSYQLNQRAYRTLAESYRATNNYLCAINALLKWELFFCHQLSGKKQSSLNLKQHYQTLQPRDLQDEGAKELKQEQRLKKKSYLLTHLQSDCTASKFKKYSHTHNQSSMDFNKGNVFDGPCRSDFEEDSHRKSKNNNKDTVAVNYDKQLDVEISGLYLLLSRLYVSIKNYNAAVVYYQKCLTYNPRAMEAVLELASLYYARHSSKHCLEWLEKSISFLQSEKDKAKQQSRQEFDRELQQSEREKLQKWQLDMGYLRYHKALILLQEGHLEQSFKLFNQLKVVELASETFYYKGLIRTKKLGPQKALKQTAKNAQIESILMLFNQSIASFTSKQYLLKSYFQILLILLFQKRDYYGAQYQVNRFRKLLPSKVEARQGDKLMKSRITKLYEQEQEGEDTKDSTKEGSFSIIFELIEGVICILKMKIMRGLSIFKELGLRLQGEAQQLIPKYGRYYNQMIKLVLQFKFYAYYIQREYELSLKHVNKLIDLMQKEGGGKHSVLSQDQMKNQNDLTGKQGMRVELKLVNVNRLMLQCMILMRQGKFNYAMSKLAEIEGLMSQPFNDQQQPTNNALILNNFNMVKALCYINIYNQLEQEKGLAPQIQQKGMDSNDDNNKEILLSAEELLRHCLISDKQNSLIYYLISVIHYELESYESSLKYIRQALQFSDDHMIKHYFCKANAKAMLGRYDEAIKDYTNAIIVFKQQTKNETVILKEHSTKKLKQKEDPGEDYYQQKQEMFNEIYLNRAIAYFKESFELSKDSKYTQNSNIISTYRSKAGQDLTKYFTGLLQTNIDLNQQGLLRQRLLLFLYSDDPSQTIQIAKKFSPRVQLLKEEDSIKIYYLVKQLNNCIVHLKSQISTLQKKCQEKEHQRTKKESLPPKYRKISIALPKQNGETSEQEQRLVRLRFDLRCLQALKKSSGGSQGALEEALINLLELTEEIYRKKEQDLQGVHHQNQLYTLEEMFANQCGEIFKWSDILFFIGVIHFQLNQYETAIKYFEESFNQKKLSSTLFSLQRYLQPVISKIDQADSEQEEFLYSELEPLFQNRVYCKEELEYNIGICYLLQKKYKEAYYYLQGHPRFLAIIKKAITIDSTTQKQNEFIAEPPIDSFKKEETVQRTKKDNHQIFIAGQCSNLLHKSFKLNQQSRDQLRSHSSQFEQSLSAISQKEGEGENDNQNITPFPTHNRLCSIYNARILDDKKFSLSFCLPKTPMPLLGIFHQKQIQLGKVCSNNDKSISDISESSRTKEADQERPNLYKINNKCFESVVNHVTLLDLEMKPIAPWVKQGVSGIVFTENVVNSSIELNSERIDRGKEKADRQTKRGKKERYASSEQNKQ